MKREALIAATIAMLSGTALAASEGGDGQIGSQSQTQSGSQQGQEGQSQTYGGDQSQQSQAGSTSAQSGGEGAGGQVIRTQSRGQILAAELMDATVTTPKQEEIGSINNLILDQDGRLAGVVVGVGGYLGIGEKEVALSWDQVDYNRQEQTATVKVSRKELEEAPAFTSHQQNQAQAQQE